MTPEYLDAVERLVGREPDVEHVAEETVLEVEEPEATVPGASMIRKLAAYWSDSRDAWLVTWQYDRSARAYELQTNSDPSVAHRWSSVWCGRDEGTWVVPYASKSGCWVRLRAMYAEGYGPWCDPLFLKPGEGVLDQAA